MFGIPGNPPVTLTPAAVGQIQKLMDKDGHWGLKLGVKKGGCAGMEYTLDYVDGPDAHDEVVEQDGVRVIIAPMAQMFLFGTLICLLYTSPSPRDLSTSRMPSSA